MSVNDTSAMEEEAEAESSYDASQDLFGDDDVGNDVMEVDAGNDDRPSVVRTAPEIFLNGVLTQSDTLVMSYSMTHKKWDQSYFCHTTSHVGSNIFMPYGTNSLIHAGLCVGLSK
jgi:hypothetical protein